MTKVTIFKIYLFNKYNNSGTALFQNNNKGELNEMEMEIKYFVDYFLKNTKIIEG